MGTFELLVDLIVDGAPVKSDVLLSGRATSAEEETAIDEILEEAAVRKARFRVRLISSNEGGKREEVIFDGLCKEGDYDVLSETFVNAMHQLGLKEK